MPFKSKAQQRFMFSQHPEMAKRWAEHTPNIKDLPEKVDSDEKKAFVTAAELGSLTVLREKAAALDPAIANALGVGGVGALAGGGLGALSGLIAPGHYDAPDEQGVLRRRQRSRLGSMLTGGLKGALGGGIAGAAIGGLGTEFAPVAARIHMQNNIDKLQKQKADIDARATTTYLDAAKKLKDQAGIGGSILAENARKNIFENLPRNEQHAQLHSHMPLIYNNPLAAGANQAVDYGKSLYDKYVR